MAGRPSSLLLFALVAMGAASFSTLHGCVQAAGLEGKGDPVPLRDATAECQPGQTMCGTAPAQYCADLNSDPDHCGYCGFSCSGHGTCSGGSCVCSDGFEGPNCDGCAADYFGYPECRHDPATGDCQCEEQDHPDYPTCQDKICEPAAGSVDNCGGCGGPSNRCCSCRSCLAYLPLPLECSEAKCKCRKEDGSCPYL